MGKSATASECLLGRCEHQWAVNIVQCSRCCRWCGTELVQKLLLLKQEALTICLSAACVALYDVFTSYCQLKMELSLMFIDL